MRKLDDTRPISKALTLHPRDDKISQLFDLIIFNVYACWYSLTGRLDGFSKDMRQRFRLVNDRLGAIDRRLAA